MKVPGNDWPGSKKAREQNGYGANGPMSYWLIHCRANWPGSEKARYPRVSIAIADLAKCRGIETIVNA